MHFRYLRLEWCVAGEVVLIQVSRPSIARIQKESVVIAATDKFGPRQIELSIDICRQQAGQNSTCNAR